MRRFFEIDGADNTGLITVGETSDANRVALTLVDDQQNTVCVLLDEEAWINLADLRYKLDWPHKVNHAPLRLTHSA